MAVIVRKTSFYIVLFAFVSSLLHVGLNPIIVRASNDYPIHNLNTGLEYGTIQGAINALETLDGHTILVEEGIYYEHVVVNKSLSLIGEHRDSTIIDGMGNGTVVTITSSNSLLRVFTLRNKGGLWGTASCIALLSSLNNMIYDNNIVADVLDGIYLKNSHGNKIFDNNITSFTDCENITTYRGIGIFIVESDNNEVFSNNITHKNDGIFLGRSCNNQIHKNNIINNDDGLKLFTSSNNNNIYDNNIMNNVFGMYFSDSSKNLLRRNQMRDNEYNFGIHLIRDDVSFTTPVSHFINDVDTSNTVDGKPIIYWVNRHNQTIPVDTGYVAVINSTNITIQGLTITNNCKGIQLVYTNNSLITENIVSETWSGINIVGSFNNEVLENSATNNIWGIDLYASANNLLSKNNVKKNKRGIYLSSSNHNIVRSNAIESNNESGIDLSDSHFNTIYNNNVIVNKMYGISIERRSDNNKIFHNTFIDNKQHANIYYGKGEKNITNIWDDGYPSGGNYWSNYAGIDTNFDGIGESPYIIDPTNLDRYPIATITSHVLTIILYALPVATVTVILLLIRKKKHVKKIELELLKK